MEEAEVIWLKKHVLDSLLYYLIVNDIFDEYTYVPKLKYWGDSKRYVNKSPEAEKDVATLIDKRFLDRLKINTATWGFLFAYRLTNKGQKRLRDIEEGTKERINQVLECPQCDTLMKIQFKNATPTFICPHCDYTSLTCPECGNEREYKVRNGHLYKMCECGEETKARVKDVSGIVWKLEDISYKAESIF